MQRETKNVNRNLFFPTFHSYFIKKEAIASENPEREN